MCYFITVELPRACTEAPAPFVLRACQQPLQPRNGGRLVEITDGHCACGLVRGGGGDEGRIAARYQKKGWSAAKIARALDGHRATAARRSQGPAVLESWLAALAREHGAVPVFIHWASAPLDPAAVHEDVLVGDLGKAPLPTEAWFAVASPA